ncbi:hypothetical protein P9139_21575 [Curtobacterium flaccumfaciens]|nr:hypothetical protein P9139_21575 [Curtobacterium flaccumfaciens]
MQPASGEPPSGALSMSRAVTVPRPGGAVWAANTGSRSTRMVSAPGNALCTSWWVTNRPSTQTRNAPRAAISSEPETAPSTIAT